MRRSSFGLIGCAALLVSLTLSGCASNDDVLTARDVRGRTPDLYSVKHNKGQLKNKEARVINSYRRGWKTDLSRFLLLDHNTRLQETTLP